MIKAAKESPRLRKQEPVEYGPFPYTKRFFNESGYYFGIFRRRGALSYTDLYKDPAEAYRAYRKLCIKFGSKNVFGQEVYERNVLAIHSETIKRRASIVPLKV